MSKQTVFLVDDEPQYLALFKEVLGEEFNCICFENALDALQHYDQLKPKTIVLDLNLPQIDGFEFCGRLFQDKCSPNDVDIIFVSGEKNTDVRLRSFEIGAADFLVKPFEIKEFQSKVRASVSRRLRELELVQEANESQKLVYTTMEQASQYNCVMNFFTKLSVTKTVEQVAEVFFATMKHFGLICSLNIRVPIDSYYRADKLEVSPIEIDVYQLLRSQGRIFPFSNRMIINDAHVSFVIKNPPQADHQLGQMRDYVASIIEGLESKVLEVYANSKVQEAITELNHNIHSLGLGISNHKALVGAVMSDMTAKIAASFHTLDMTEIQETFLNQLIESSADKLSNAEQQLFEVMNRLELIRDELAVVQDAFAQMDNKAAHDNDEVELF